LLDFQNNLNIIIAHVQKCYLKLKKGIKKKGERGKEKKKKKKRCSRVCFLDLSL
jgi:hypothetical protein